MSSLGLNDRLERDDDLLYGGDKNTLGGERQETWVRRCKADVGGTYGWTGLALLCGHGRGSRCGSFARPLVVDWL